VLNGLVQYWYMRHSILFDSKCDAIGIKIMKKKIWLLEVKDF